MTAKGTEVVRVEPPTIGPCPLRFVVLGAWDDLSGPAAHCVFAVERDLDVSPELPRDLAKMALSYHLSDPEKINYFAACELSDMGLCGFNCVFSARIRRRQCMTCLFFVFPRSYCSLLKGLTAILSSFWEEKIDRLKVFQQSNAFTQSETIELLSSSFLPEFCDLAAQLEWNRSFVQHLPLKIDFASIHFEDKFVQRCIASHLITFGRSLVVGAEVEAVNRMIFILRLFSLPAHRPLCVFLPSEPSQRRFHAELMVQGLPQDATVCPISVWDLLSARWPLTIIYLRRKKVQQSLPLSAHRTRKKTFLAASITAFLRPPEGGVAPAPADLFSGLSELKTNGLITDGNVISFEVEELCAELLSFQGSAELCVSAINLFLRQMMVRAKTLISYANELNGRASANVSVSLKHLWNALNITTEGDYMILLAFAELFQPNCIMTLERFF